MMKIRLPGWLIPNGTRIVMYRIPDGKEVQRKFTRSRERFKHFYDVVMTIPKRRIRVNIKRVDKYRDGGTILIETDQGVYCFDYRIDSKTKGRLYKGYPEPDNSNLLEDELLEKQLLYALSEYRDEREQSRIDSFLEAKQREGK